MTQADYMLNAANASIEQSSRLQIAVAGCFIILAIVAVIWLVHRVLNDWANTAVDASGKKEEKNEDTVNYDEFVGRLTNKYKFNPEEIVPPKPREETPTPEEIEAKEKKEKGSKKDAGKKMAKDVVNAASGFGDTKSPEPKKTSSKASDEKKKSPKTTKKAEDEKPANVVKVSRPQNSKKEEKKNIDVDTSKVDDFDPSMFGGDTDVTAINF